MKKTVNESFFAKQELPIDGVSFGTYRELRRDKLLRLYNKTCTFLHLKTSYTNQSKAKLLYYIPN
jgi:hypothetical protein